MIFDKHLRRRAISPILAEVALIAITLVAATAMSGFVFGTMTSYTSTAQIQIVSSNCSASTNTCTVFFQNTGTSTGTISGVSINFGGAGYLPLTCTPATQTIKAGAAPVSIVCTGYTGASLNEQYTISSTASNTAQPLGAGAFSA